MNENFIVKRESLQTAAEKESGSGMFQRSRAEGHSGLIYKVAKGFSLPHLEELSKQQLTGVTQVWLRLPPVSRARIGLNCSAVLEGPDSYLDAEMDGEL